MGKLAPKHCPKCGSTNIHNQELEPSNDLEEQYDVFCRDCEWSGDISPDLPMIPKEKMGPEEMKELKTRKREALRGGCVHLEEVLKKQGAKTRVKTLGELKTQLQRLKPTLQEKYGVQTLGIFGSYCRGEQTRKSDLDIIVEYFPDAHPGMFKLLELENFLAHTLGVKVDLGTKTSLKPHIRERVLQEAVYVFPEPVRVKANRKWGNEAFQKSGEATFGK